MTLKKFLKKLRRDAIKENKLIARDVPGFKLLGFGGEGKTTEQQVEKEFRRDIRFLKKQIKKYKLEV